MFTNYKIKNINGEEVLYLYVDDAFEFAKEFSEGNQENNNQSLMNQISEFIKKQKIVFNGIKIFLIANGVIALSLLTSNLQSKSMDNYLNTANETSHQLEVNNNEQEIMNEIQNQSESELVFDSESDENQSITNSDQSQEETSDQENTNPPRSSSRSENQGNTNSSNSPSRSENQENSNSSSSPSRSENQGNTNSSSAPSRSENQENSNSSSAPSKSENQGNTNSSRSPSRSENQGNTNSSRSPSRSENQGKTTPPRSPSRSENQGKTTPPRSPSRSENQGNTNPSSAPSRSENQGNTNPSSAPSRSENQGNTNSSRSPSRSENQGNTNSSNSPSRSENQGNTNSSNSPSRSENQGNTNSSNSPSRSENQGNTNSSSAPSRSENQGNTNSSNSPSKSENQGNTNSSRSPSRSENQGNTNSSNSPSKSENQGNTNSSNSPSKSENQGNTNSSSSSKSENQGNTNSSSSSRSENQGNTNSSNSPSRSENQTNSTNNSIMVTVKRRSGVTIKIALEEYLIGVVGAEMPASFHSEALKAQALGARTYTMKFIQEGKTLTDTVSTQAYYDNDQLKALWGSNYTTYYNKIKNAVNSTAGEAIYHKNRYIDAVYHSTNNGFTSDSVDVWGNNIPYLKSVESSWDKDANSYLRSETKGFDVVSFVLGMNINQNSDIQVVSRTSNNSIKKLTVNGVSYNGTTFRSLLGLRSTDFDIVVGENGITFTTRGYGHGVGMSQYGANGMAKSGYNYKQIISHYYKGVTINKI